MGRRLSLVEVASRLGIDLDRDPDLWWIAERALLITPVFGAVSNNSSSVATVRWTAAKPWTARSLGAPPPGRESAVDVYSRLARIARVGWPSEPSKASPFLGGGWWRATARSSFDAMAQGELSFGLGDVLLVQHEDHGDGWWMAVLESSPESFGLVPSDFMRLHDVLITAPAPYRAVSSGEHSFSAGDQIIIRPGNAPGRGWWMGKLGARRGYVEWTMYHYISEPLTLTLKGALQLLIKRRG